MTDRRPFDVDYWQKRCDDFMTAVRQNKGDAIMLCIVTLDGDDALVQGNGEGWQMALDAGIAYFTAKFGSDGDSDDIEAVYEHEVN